eukprot:TRINITY_DN12500_c0_g1_i1.p1 TRINITY_DN12500_c0_g1~~TRINITY_DN12500_c0_g1_i1.p1  ORF type:complete len:315 (+),score=34.81 TRINITY_DN12500_c0_g1_i1:43-987(+)
MAALPNLVRGLEELAPRYDVILFDQYGCIHDGVAPLPGACDALERLKGECKQMVVLSNTSSRRDATCRKFVNMGFSAAYMCDFITSGQCAHEHLAKHYVGKKCLWFTWESYASDTYLSDVGVQWTENVDEADLVLFHGSQTLARSARDDGIALGLFEHGISALEQSNARLREGSAIELLRSAARRGLPAINANPDFTVMFPDGTARHMPGCLADAYDALLRDISGTPGARQRLRSRQRRQRLRRRPRRRERQRERRQVLLRCALGSPTARTSAPPSPPRTRSGPRGRRRRACCTLVTRCTTTCGARATQAWTRC